LASKNRVVCLIKTPGAAPAGGVTNFSVSAVFVGRASLVGHVNGPGRKKDDEDGEEQRQQRESH
jgi:hypothetical protein